MQIQDYLKLTVEMGGSDLFVVPGLPVTVKVGTTLHRIDENRLVPAQTEELIRQIYALASSRQTELLDENGDDDFSFALGQLSRFRLNAYKQRGTWAAACRVLPMGLPDPVKLNIPEQVMALTELVSGMVLVTGPAGSGKSTTLACIIDRINSTREGHIVTIEDPIEYLHTHKKCIVSQREVPSDAPSFDRALRAALRQVPDVIMLGEMRDEVTIQTAITTAETGHLMLSSLHTVGAAKAVDRIIDVFSTRQQQQVYAQLATVLKAVVSQRLVPTLDHNVVPVFEVMTVTPAIQNMIRDGKIFQIDNAIYSGGGDRGMLSMDNELLRLYKEGRISRDNAIIHAVNPDAQRKRIL